ncbi:unnamed protein product [Ambrosiozyma monospora]|uniref:Unnamed protein product n=1 Tax=Ambrosiozyma monospora TaxID=43982 RepID=A0ACB5SVS3_AMBMO|nr:unnamed protein product [Ambrosiozyma monospora]
MKFEFVFLAILLRTVTASKWHVYPDPEYKVMACKAGLESVAAWCSGTSKSFKCACKNKPALGSWLNCVYNQTTKHDVFAAESQVIKYCDQVNVTLTHEKLKDAYANATNYLVDVSKDESFNKTKPINYPITFSKKAKKAYKGYYIGYKHRFGNVTTSHYLGIASLSMWGALLVIASALHWIGKLVPSAKKSLTGGLFNNYRKSIALAPTFSKTHLQASEKPWANGYFPTRFESIVLIIHFIYCVVACSVIGFTYTEGDKVFKNYMAGTSRYYGDRAGIILSYQLPLLFLFAGRNNFLQWMTGWQYNRFVTFHKWLARIIMMEVLIHSFAFVAQSDALGKTHSRLQAEYYRHGIVATVAGCLILPLAAYIVRKFAYEIFLFVHIVLVVMFTWTAYVHAESQHYENFYWACCGVWIFDRLVRFIRACVFGIRTAKATFLVDEATIKLTVPCSSYMKPFPGAHVFVQFLTPTTFWQSHPFTIVSSITDENHFHLYCKVKNGITKKLLQKFQATEGSEVNVKVLVEGFYGQQSPYHHYDKAVLIAGGNGISGPFSHALKLATSDSKTETKLFWQVREYSVLNWFGEELMQLKNTRVQPVIYVSNPNSTFDSVHYNSPSSSSSDNSDSDSGEKNTSSGEKTKDANDSHSSMLDKFGFIEFHQGRLNATEVVASEIRESVGSVAFGACGHPAMVDEVRVAVKNNLSGSSKRIEYFEEMQSW